MRTELTYTDRGYIANLLRRRAITLADSSRTTKADRQRVELEEEAGYAEGLALRLDDGEELALEPPKPITPNPRIDLDSIDRPQSKGGDAKA